MMMADQNPEKDSFFKEIDEELRQESYAKLWKKYGKYLIGIAVIFVAKVPFNKAGRFKTAFTSV